MRLELDPCGPPGPGAVVLHQCRRGRDVCQLWMDAADPIYCDCGAVLAPDQPLRLDHTYFDCDNCGRRVGLCAQAADAALLAEALHIVEGASVG